MYRDLLGKQAVVSIATFAAGWLLVPMIAFAQGEVTTQKGCVVAISDSGSAKVGDVLSLSGASGSFKAKVVKAQGGKVAATVEGAGGQCPDLKGAKVVAAGVDSENKSQRDDKERPASKTSQTKSKAGGNAIGGFAHVGYAIQTLKGANGETAGMGKYSGLATSAYGTFTFKTSGITQFPIGLGISYVSGAAKESGKTLEVPWDHPSCPKTTVPSTAPCPSIDYNAKYSLAMVGVGLMGGVEFALKNPSPPLVFYFLPHFHYGFVGNNVVDVMTSIGSGASTLTLSWMRYGAHMGAAYTVAKSMRIGANLDYWMGSGTVTAPSEINGIFNTAKKISISGLGFSVLLGFSL